MVTSSSMGRGVTAEYHSLVFVVLLQLTLLYSKKKRLRKGHFFHFFKMNVHINTLQPQTYFHIYLYVQSCHNTINCPNKSKPTASIFIFPFPSTMDTYLARSLLKAI